MKVDVHILSHDDEQMLGWALKHYRSWGFPDQVRIIVHDGGPTCKNRELVEHFGAEFDFWDTAGELNDELARHLKNTCWKGTDADWVIIVDADELLYFPSGVWPTLQLLEDMGAVVPKPQGFEMLSDSWFDLFVDVECKKLKAQGQIYDWAPDGAPDDEWYSKPVIFSAKRVAESGIGIGGHESRPVLKSGRSIYVARGWPKAKPEFFLLHYHQIGGIDRVAERYDATRARLSLINVERGYGNFKPGIEHAQEKRDMILPRLRKVVAS